LYNILTKRNLFTNNVNSNIGIGNSIKFNTNSVLFSEYDILSSIFLQKKKANLNEAGKILFFKKDFLFTFSETELGEDKLYKQTFFKKPQQINEFKNLPLLEISTTYITRT